MKFYLKFSSLYTPCTCRWVSECGEIFRRYKVDWAHLMPSSPDQPAVLAEHFFNAASSLMARQLRETVEKSLQDFLQFLSHYQIGNDYQEEFNNLLFVSKPVSLK